jgi:hypothetical protein
VRCARRGCKSPVCDAHLLQVMMPRCPCVYRGQHSEAVPACEGSTMAATPACVLTLHCRFISSRGDLGCSAMTFSVVVSG